MTSPETASSPWAATEGLPFPLGPTRLEGEGAHNFALYSKHAQSLTLLLYTESDIVNPVLAYRFDYLRNKTGRIWHCRIPLVSMRGASYYAYSVDGPKPTGRFEWHWFDRDKILLDPYAKSVFFPPTFDRLAAARPGSNTGKAPLGVLTGDSERFDWHGDHRPRHEADTIIYELHVGGFTRPMAPFVLQTRRRVGSKADYRGAKVTKRVWGERSRVYPKRASRGDFAMLAMAAPGADPVTVPFETFSRCTSVYTTRASIEYGPMGDIHVHPTNREGVDPEFDGVDRPDRRRERRVRR